MPRITRIAAILLFVTSTLIMLSANAAQARDADAFASDWANTPDRVWLGAPYWANPMEDWQVRTGRAECLSNRGDRNVHLLTHSIGDQPGDFTISVRCGVIEQGQRGGVGLRVGIRDQIDDYRGNCFFGKGIDAGVGNGELYLGTKSQTLATDVSMADLRVQLQAIPQERDYRLVLTVFDGAGETELGRMNAVVPADKLVGNIAIVNNFSPQVTNASRFWFSHWRVSGTKIVHHPDRAFGPVLWAMYTLSDSRGPEGYVLKLTAQMPPLGDDDSRDVRLERRENGQWRELDRAGIDPDARTATFRVPDWDHTRPWPYRLAYNQRGKDASGQVSYYEGTIQAEPQGRPLVIGGLTCQYHYGFPYGPLVENLSALDPDLLYFSGDQIYEPNGGYGIVRSPADRAILCYLRKWYMFGWAFGDLMRNRPTLCLPDDHDVFQGNLWGEGGRKMAGNNASTDGGYIQPVQMVNAVHRVHTSHHPDPFDPTPADNGVSVYYGDMVYARVSFAIVADRQFKSGPEHVDTGRGRADLVLDEGIDTSKLDKPGLQLLGQRQEAFLEHWVEDWLAADMKMLLSQTLWADVNTQSGKFADYLVADLDTGGWPQTARNRAIRIARKAFPLHLCGDQHITSIVQYGVEEQRDSFWALCTPAITVGWQRWWMPDMFNWPVGQRPDHGRENTGEYVDGFGNLIYVYAVANPEGTNDPDRYRQAAIRASGFSIVRVDTDQRTYTMESYPFSFDPQDDQPDQFEGWPFTVRQQDNYGRQRAGTLPNCQAPAGVTNPVVKLYKDNGELVYALRAQGPTFRPFVFEPGRYTVKIGDPDTGQWNMHQGMEIVASEQARP